MTYEQSCPASSGTDGKQDERHKRLVTVINTFLSRTISGWFQTSLFKHLNRLEGASDDEATVVADVQRASVLVSSWSCEILSVEAWGDQRIHPLYVLIAFRGLRRATVKQDYVAEFISVASVP
jgi:hypothetical protein